MARAGGGVGAPASDRTPVGQLGPYVLFERLAIGGMAEVFLARRTEAGSPPVVVKRILAHLADDEQFIDMFRDEARIVSLVQHPGVARIVELGREGDEYYLVLELVAGEPLSRVMTACARQEATMPPGLAAHVIAQAAAALDHAHRLTDERGKPLRLVHRDVSPDNILLAISGAVKLIDFGIAKGTGRITRTEVGAAKGKFSYMSPEQARGQQVDHRTDVFALGVVLWEMVAAKRLFHRSNELETLRAVVGEPHPLLSRVAGVSADLDPILDRALAKDPEQRYPTAGDLQRALERYAAHAGGEVGPGAVGRFMRTSFPDRCRWWQEKVTAIVSAGAAPATTPLMAVTPNPTATTPGPEVVYAFDDDGPTRPLQRAALTPAAPLPPVVAPAPPPATTAPARLPPWILIAGGVAAAALLASGAWWLTRPRETPRSGTRTTAPAGPSELRIVPLERTPPPVPMAPAPPVQVAPSAPEQPRVRGARSPGVPAAGRVIRRPEPEGKPADAPPGQKNTEVTATPPEPPPKPETGRRYNNPF